VVDVALGVGGVTEASLSDDGVEILADEAATLLPEMLEKVSSTGAVVAAVEVIEPNLEAVFLHVTGKALRD
jgi:ABC-2 type transport system ATP-binding protein